MTKRLIGGSDGRNNLAPIEYPWAWNAYENAGKNFWLPGQIGMADDRLQWETGQLTPAEMHVYKTVFATLTTSDVLIQRNIATAIMQVITAPEVEVALAAQCYQEAVHSHTYKHVLEVLGFHEEEVYTLYERVPEIRRKFEVAAKYTDDIIYWRSDEDAVISLLRGLIFFYCCFEGAWFYHGFSPIFSLARRNLMARSSEQLQYIMRDESNHCLFGIDLIKGIMRENGIDPHLYVYELTKPFLDAVAAEQTYIDYVMKDPIVGYSAGIHMQHTEYLLDLRMQQIGLPRAFNAAPTLPWLDEMVMIKKEKNFFESHVTEYQKTQLSWDD